MTESIYICCRCYLVANNTKFKTFGNRFVHAILAVYHAMESSVRPMCEMVNMYGAVWAVIEMPKRELSNVRSITATMGLRFVKGMPPFFSASSHVAATFPVQGANVYTADGDLKFLKKVKS